jgi:hypothetical protein
MYYFTHEKFAIVFFVAMLSMPFLMKHTWSDLFEKKRLLASIRRRGEGFFSMLMPLANDMQILQDTVNASHLLIGLSSLTSWQKVDLGIQIRAAEEALMRGREILQKYDPSLLPK